MKRRNLGCSSSSNSSEKRFYVRGEGTELSNHEIPDFDRGMQKMVVETVISYLLSESAEDLGIIGLQVIKEGKGNEVLINSMFISDNEEDKDERESVFDNKEDERKYIDGVLDGISEAMEDWTKKKSKEVKELYELERRKRKSE